MQKILYSLCAILLVSLLSACTDGARQQNPTKPALQVTPFTPTPQAIRTRIPFIAPTSRWTTPVVTEPAEGREAAYAMVKQLGRGVNLGNALEAPQEGEWGVTLQEEFFQLIAEAGFNTVRVPIRWSTHAAAQAPYTIDPAFMNRIDWVVAQAQKHGLNVILNMHHYEEIFKDPAGHQARFVAIWQQIADHYQSQPDNVLFEFLNEPNGQVDDRAWNRLILDTLAVVRPTNPQRMIVVGPANWNNLANLEGLKLPVEDPYLIVTFHYYEPFRFTHQGAEWVNDSTPWLGTTWEGNTTESATLAQHFKQVAEWSTVHHRPIFLGEFGAYNKADLASRARYTTAVARQAEQMGFAWAYWEFCSGFGIYNLETKTWLVELKGALIP